MKLPVLVMVAACALNTGVARAQSEWGIDDFRVAVEIAADGRLIVTETITANFAGPRHGIYRTIPVHYTVALHQYSLRFRLLEVGDGAGGSRTTKLSRDGASVRIRIGDPNVTISGRQTYLIRYEIQRAILHEMDRAVLRWNATGNEWEASIGAATVTVTMPAALGDSAVSWEAWTGLFGATDRNFEARRVDERTLEFTTGMLKPREGISVEISLPAGTVAAPGWAQRAGWILTDNLAYQVFLIVLAGCLITWYRRGRDPEGRGSIAVQYDAPEDLGPAEVGTLADERVHMQDISAAIVDMAVRGHISIEEIPKSGLLAKPDYSFVKKRGSDALRDYEQLLHKALFKGRSAVLLSDLETVFHETVDEVRKSIYDGLARRGYFDGNPDSVRKGFGGRWILLMIVLLVVTGIIQRWLAGRVMVGPLVIAAVLSVITIVLTSRVMPRRTHRGRLAWERIKGLEEYLQRAEQRELNEQERQGVFEKLLPHAVALGLTTRWARAFEGIYQKPPDWYRSRGDGSFSTRSLTDSLDRSVSRMNSTLPSQPRSSSSGSSGGFSGGGSSGGGFGGGGGGAW